METGRWGTKSSSEEPVGSVYPGHLIFTGSSENDVALAKQFWVSATMHPHSESRLVSNSMEQRLPVTRSAGRTVAERSFKIEDYKTKQLLEKSRKAQEAEEKERYFEKAKKRREILDLLRKQREERIEKELVSLLHKPKMKVPHTKKVLTKSKSEEEEVRAVGQLN